MYLKRLVIIALLLLTASAFADIKQAQIFTDSMVIQRETKAPIWGWAEPGEQVEVSGSWGKTASAVTDKDGKWQVCSPETAGGFSGLAYYTARDLHKELKVPIGLIIAASGGTFIQSYISAEYLKDDHWAKIQEKQAAVYTEEKANADYKQKLEVWAEEAKKTKAENKKVPSKPRLERDPRKDKNYPGSLYRGTIAPIEPFGLKGAIWYQGENEATTPIHAFGPNRAERYRVNLRNLINSGANNGRIQNCLSILFSSPISRNLKKIPMLLPAAGQLSERAVLMLQKTCLTPAWLWPSISAKSKAFTRKTNMILANVWRR